MAFTLPHGDTDPAAPIDRWARAADARAARRVRAATGDLFLPDPARLDDRTRAALQGLLTEIVGAVEQDLRGRAARLLAARGATGTAEGLLGGEPVHGRLLRSGVLRDPDLMEELIARVELDLLAEKLPIRVIEPDRPGLLVRLADSADEGIAAAALALLAAEHHRRAAGEGTGPVRSDLPAELHQRLCWWLAAAIREQAGEGPGSADRDRALTEAVLQGLSAHDEGERPEAAAARLASALDVSPERLGPLSIEALADGRAMLFIALLARAAATEYEPVRHIVIDPDDRALILLLHAIGIDREPIASIAVALVDADPRRDLDRSADAIDAALALNRAAAAEALAPLALSRDFRAAVRALEGRP